MLRDVELRADPGSYLALVGPSGSGKTTLLSILGGLERPQTGVVMVGGRDLARCSGPELADFRREAVGFVFQHFGLLDTATALENVELALSLSRCSRRFRRRKAAGLLARVGLEDRLAHYPTELSGGERQRVGMARALANDPQLILADEPTGNLDGVTAMTVIELLEELRATHGCTLLIATHDRALALRAERLISLVDGRAVEGPDPLNIGHTDIGHTGIGHTGIGHTDIGHTDIGHTDIGHTDIGPADIRPQR